MSTENGKELSVRNVDGGLELLFRNWQIQQISFDDRAAALYIEVGPDSCYLRLALTDFEFQISEKTEMVSMAEKKNLALVLQLFGRKITKCIISREGVLELSFSDGQFVLRCHPDECYETAWQIWSLKGDYFHAESFAEEGFGWGQGKGDAQGNSSEQD